MKKLLLLGTHGQYNIGDELLLEAFLETLKLDFDITVNSYTPEETAKDFKVATFDTDGSYISIVKTIFKNDVILFAGVNILKEMYVEYGRSRYSTLYKILAMVIVGKLFFKPIVIACIGVGPLRTKWSKFLTWLIVKMAKHTSVRDEKSIEYTNELGFGSEVKFIPDIAFSLNKEYWKTEKKAKSSISKKTFALNLCKNIANPKNWDYYVENLAKDLNNYYQNNEKFEIVGIPMQESFNGPADYKTLEDFKDLLHNLNPEIQFNIARPKTARDVANIIQNADFVLSERLHLLILCMVIGVPFVALEYDVKITGFLSTYGLSQYGIDISTKFGENTIYEAIKSVNDNYKSIESHIDKVANKNYKDVTNYKILLKKELSE